MRLIILVASMLSAASAASLVYVAPLHNVVYPGTHVYSTHQSSLVTPSQRQYHVQDDLGQYAYGYDEPLSSKEELRSHDGVTRGSYNYLDAEGKIQTVAYTADLNGFRVAASNLPRAPLASETPAPVADTAEVAAARRAHLAAHKEAALRVATSQSASADNRSDSVQSATNSIRYVELPKPVQDTPAVALAKAEHLKRFQYEKVRNALISSSAAANPAIVRTVIPSVYNYGYPLNARLLSTGYYY